MVEACEGATVSGRRAERGCLEVLIRHRLLPQGGFERPLIPHTQREDPPMATYIQRSLGAGSSLLDDLMIASQSVAESLAPVYLPLTFPRERLRTCFLSLVLSSAVCARPSRVSAPNLARPVREGAAARSLPFDLREPFPPRDDHTGPRSPVLRSRASGQGWSRACLWPEAAGRGDAVAALRVVGERHRQRSGSGDQARIPGTQCLVALGVESVARDFGRGAASGTHPPGSVGRSLVWAYSPGRRSWG